MATNNPTPKPPAVPASAPIASVILGAASLAIQAIVPLATGSTINWALMVATFIVVFGGSMFVAVYHVQLPSSTQAILTTTITALLESLSARLSTPPPAPTVIVHPAVAATEPTPAVSTDVPTHP